MASSNDHHENSDRHRANQKIISRKTHGWHSICFQYCYVNNGQDRRRRSYAKLTINHGNTQRLGLGTLYAGAVGGHRCVPYPSLNVLTIQTIALRLQTSLWQT